MALIYETNEKWWFLGGVMPREGAVETRVWARGNFELHFGAREVRDTVESKEQERNSKLPKSQQSLAGPNLFDRLKISLTSFIRSLSLRVLRNYVPCFVSSFSSVVAADDSLSRYEYRFSYDLEGPSSDILVGYNRVYWHFNMFKNRSGIWLSSKGSLILKLTLRERTYVRILRINFPYIVLEYAK